MTLAVIARGDQGGLGAQTWEMCRHVGPDKILLLDLGKAGRGTTRRERFEGLAGELRVHGGSRLDHGDLDWVLKDTTTIYTAEGTYGYDLPVAAERAGVRLVVHANPELWTERSRGATTEVVCPTPWEIDRVPGATMMPMPVDRERVPFRERRRAFTFWHPKAPAFHDRHGSAIVEAALAHIKTACRVLITGETELPLGPSHVGQVLVDRVGPRENYWDGYRFADVLILPRRYAGLCLPVQEALSSGMPVVMLDTGPYAGKAGVLTIPTTSSYEVRMKGGQFPVFDAEPEALANEIDQLVYDHDLVGRCSRAADGTAEGLSWARWENWWRRLLHG